MNTIITRDLIDFKVPFAYLQPTDDLRRLCVPGEEDLADQGYRIAMYPNTGYSFLVRLTEIGHMESGIRFHVLESFELDQRVTHDGAITARRGDYRTLYYVNPDFVDGGQFAQP